MHQAASGQPEALSDLGLQDDGIVAKLLVKAGTKDIPVGTPMAVLVEEAEHVAAFKDYQAGQSSGKSQPETDARPSSSGRKLDMLHTALQKWPACSLIACELMEVCGWGWQSGCLTGVPSSHGAPYSLEAAETCSTSLDLMQECSET